MTYIKLFMLTTALAAASLVPAVFAQSVRCTTTERLPESISQTCDDGSTQQVYFDTGAGNQILIDDTTGQDPTIPQAPNRETIGTPTDPGWIEWQDYTGTTCRRPAAQPADFYPITCLTPAVASPPPGARNWYAYVDDDGNQWEIRVPIPAVPTAKGVPSAQSSPSTPTEIPAAPVCQTYGSIQFDCGNLIVVPFGQMIRIAVHRIGCIYEAISEGCSTLPSNQLIEVTVLQVERDVTSEGSTDPREEAVLARVRVHYVDGPLGSKYDGYSIPDISNGWRTTDGREGRNNHFVKRLPHLSSLNFGETGEGWVGGFIPRGADPVMVARSGEHDHVFFKLK